MRKVLILILFFILFPNINLAIDAEILESQTKALGIADFINTSKDYMGETLGDINLQDVFGEAITGKIETKNIFKNTRYRMRKSHVIPIYSQITPIIYLHFNSTNSRLLIPTNSVTILTHLIKHSEVYRETSYYCIISHCCIISHRIGNFIFSWQKGTEEAGRTAGAD